MSSIELDIDAPPAPCPFATVLGSEDLVRHLLGAGGLGACTAALPLSHALHEMASACVAELADLAPHCIVAPGACELQNPSYMIEVDEGVLVSSCCAAGGPVGKLAVYDADGQLVRTLRPRLPRSAQFSNPRGVALDESGAWLYVVDRDTSRVLKMSRTPRTSGLDTCQLLRQKGRGRRRGGGADGPGLACPQGLCAHEGRLYVADRDNHRVLVLGTRPSPEQLSDVLEVTARIGGCGDEPGQLYCPMGLAVLAAEDALVVCDAMNSRLQLFALAPPHALLRCFGTEGAAPGQFRGPFGVAVSPCGARLHVAEAAGARVQTLTTAGVPLQVLSLPGCVYPFGVCVHGPRVFVSDFHGGLHVLQSRREAASASSQAST